MQLGDGSTRSSATPVPSLGIFDAIAVTGGAIHGHALLEDGTVRVGASTSSPAWAASARRWPRGP
jgi:hypothetical protein